MPPADPHRNTRVTVSPALRQDLTEQYSALYDSRPSRLQTAWDLKEDWNPPINHEAPSRNAIVSFFQGQTLQTNRWLVDGLCQLLRGDPYSSDDENFDMPVGRLSNVPALPSCYVERTQDLEVVQKLLVEAGEGDRISPIVAIVGTGGIGKTSLAIAIARSPKIQAYFPEGILWITLGPEPKLILRQLDLLSLVTDETFLFRDVEQGRIRLEKLLAGRKILLILDDVWDEAHLRAFKIASSQICILVTTRNRRIARSCQAKTHPVTSLSYGEAITFLEKYYPDDQIPTELGRKILKCTGHYPLILAMLGTRLTGEPSHRWDTIANSLASGGVMSTIGPYPPLEYQHKNLREATEVSLQKLSGEIRQFYESLAIFPKNCLIPELTLVRYGQTQGLSDLDTEEALYQLVDRSLLQWAENNCLTLYIFHYDYLQSIQQDSQHLQYLHGQLIQSYRNAYPEGLHTVKSDGYFYRYITYHLQEARLQEDIHDFLNNLVTPFSHDTTSSLAPSEEGSKALTEILSNTTATERVLVDPALLTPENTTILKNCFEVYMGLQDMPQLLGFATKNRNLGELFKVFIHLLDTLSPSDVKLPQVLEKIIRRVLVQVKTKMDNPPTEDSE
jgi:hypothetical protein